MGKKKAASKTKSSSTGHCEILGKELNQALKQLRVAFPKRKAEKERASVMIHGLTEGLRFGLPGADVLVTAKVSAEFLVVMPWARFKQTFVTPWKATETIKLEFSDQCMSVNGVAVRSPEFKFHSAIDKKTIRKNEPRQDKKLEANIADTPLNPDAVDSPYKPALLDAHFYIKKYGFRQFLVNRDFVDQQYALKIALDQAARILEPIGITRKDIEQMIEEKIKKMPGYEADDKK